jgi:hypothetical protein
VLPKTKKKKSQWENTPFPMRYIKYTGKKISQKFTSTKDYKRINGLGAVAHACNPGHCRARYQEDRTLRSAWAKS